MSTEFIANTVTSLMTSTVKIVTLVVFLGVVAFLAKLLSNLLPNKYRDGRIAPEITEHVEPDYINNLNKEMADAGVDNLSDLEQYKESKKLTSLP